MKYELDKPVLIHVCKDGTVTYRTRDQKVFNGVALPVHSVDTIEEAEAIQITLCKAQYEEHPQLPGQVWYRLPNYFFNGTIDVLGDVAERMQDLSQYFEFKRKENTK